MPVVVTPLARKVRLFLLALPLLACVSGEYCMSRHHCMTTAASALVAAWWSAQPVTWLAFLATAAAIWSIRAMICPMLANSACAGQSARNETIAFQLILRSEDLSQTSQVLIKTDTSDFKMSLYQAHYLQIRNGGYRWGPATDVLPYPAAYPDALIPQQQQCGADKTRLFDTVQLPPPGQNQSVWVEMYVPDNASVGVHPLRIRLTSLGEGEPGMQGKMQYTIDLQLTLNVVDVTIPHSTSIDAIGEVYRSYRLEGAFEDRSQERLAADGNVLSGACTSASNGVHRENTG